MSFDVLLLGSSDSVVNSLCTLSVRLLTYLVVRNGNQCIWHQKLHDFRSDYYGLLSCGLLNAKEMETESDYIVFWIIHWGFSLLAAVSVFILVTYNWSVYLY